MYKQTAGCDVILSSRIELNNSLLQFVSLYFSNGGSGVKQEAKIDFEIIIEYDNSRHFHIKQEERDEEQSETSKKLLECPGIPRRVTEPSFKTHEFKSSNKPASSIPHWEWCTLKSPKIITGEVIESMIHLSTKMTEISLWEYK